MFLLAVLSLIVSVAALVVATVRRSHPVVASSAAHDGARPRRRPGTVARTVGLAGLGVTVLLLAVASLYTQSVGQAKVVINPGGTISHADATPGFGVKAPWQSISTWDLFSQNVTYAGSADDGAPVYTGGEVNGLEITSSVQGGAQTNFDLSATYSVDGNQVEDLYREFRTQERFTQQVIEPRILATVREVPTAYEPQEFRGEKRGEATDRMLANLNTSLERYGVTVSLVNLQNIKYLDDVENAIKAVEVAQQREAEAEANLRATQVSAQARVVEAQAEADANRLLSESLTPQVLEQRRIEAMKEGTVFVVPEGSTPLVQLNN